MEDSENLLFRHIPVLLYVILKILHTADRLLHRQNGGAAVEFDFVVEQGGFVFVFHLLEVVGEVGTELEVVV